MEALGIASGVAGIISLGITVCQGLLDYYDSWKDAQASVAQMYASIEALTKTLRLLETALKHEHFLRDIVARVEECIRSVENGFQSLQKKLDKVQLVPSDEGWKARAKSQFRRAEFPFKESTLIKLKELGSELRDDLSLALSLLQIDSSGIALQKLDLVGRRVAEVSTNVTVLADQSTFISKNVKDIKAFTLATSESVNDLVLAEAHNYTRKVCNWLSPLSVEFQKKQLDTFNIPNRQDGTSQWFFETSEFNDWLSGTGTSLWCPGIRESNRILNLSKPQGRLPKIVVEAY